MEWSILLLIIRRVPTINHSAVVHAREVVRQSRAGLDIVLLFVNRDELQVQEHQEEFEEKDDKTEEHDSPPDSLDGLVALCRSPPDSRVSDDPGEVDDEGENDGVENVGEFLVFDLGSVEEVEKEEDDEEVEVGGTGQGDEGEEEHENETGDLGVEGVVSLEVVLQSGHVLVEIRVALVVVDSVQLGQDGFVEETLEGLEETVQNLLVLLDVLLQLDHVRIHVLEVVFQQVALVVNELEGGPETYVADLAVVGVLEVQPLVLTVLVF